MNPLCQALESPDVRPLYRWTGRLGGGRAGHTPGHKDREGPRWPGQHRAQPPRKVQLLGSPQGMATSFLRERVGEQVTQGPTREGEGQKGG